MDVEVLQRHPFRAKAPGSLLARFRRLGRIAAVIPTMDRLQPRRAAVTRRERHSTAEVRTQPRPGEFPALGIEQDLLPLARRGRFVVRPLIPGLQLGKRLGAVPSPIVHCRIVGQRLFLLGVLVARLALRRHLHFDPMLDRHLGRRCLPIGLVLSDLERLAAVPIDRRADQLVARRAHLHAADAVRQFHQRLHHVGLETGRLQSVVHAPESPHARHVMLRDVAMEHELARQCLQSP